MISTSRAERVLVRVDFNVPLEDGRRRELWRSPTTPASARRCPRSKSCAGAARRLVLVSHLGRPEGRPGPGALAGARWRARLRGADGGAR